MVRLYTIKSESLALRIILLGLLLAGVCQSPANGALVRPHVNKCNLNLGPYGAIAPLGLTFWKNRVYLTSTCADQAPSVYRANATDPNNLAFEASTSPGNKAFDLKVVEDYLYVANWNPSFRIFDAYGNMTQRFEWDLPAVFANDLDVVGNRAYLGGREGSFSPSYLYIFDVTDPPNSRLITTFNMNALRGFEVRGSYVYAIDGDFFKVVNISDELSPRIIASINLGTLLGDIRIRGDYAYICYNAQTYGGFYVYDISDPDSPSFVSHYLRNTSKDTFLFGDYAFVPTGGNGVETVDISDPANPRHVTTVQLPFYALEMAVTGNGKYLYIGSAAESQGWLSTYEVFTSDPDDAGPGNCSEFSYGEAPWEAQYEANALPRLSSPAWKIFEGSEASASVSDGIMRINDTGSGDIKWWRGWDATNTRGTTVIFKAKCDSYALNGQSAANLANVFLEDGKYKERFTVLPNMIRACIANIEVPIDPSTWHTFRITTQGSQFKVYVDENPSPALTGTLTSTTNRARIMLGVGSGAASQDISFDYLHYYSNGVHPPPAVLDTPAPDFGVKMSEIAGKGSMSGIDPTSAKVWWSTNGGESWNSSTDTSFWDCHYGGMTFPTMASPAWTVIDGSQNWARLEPGVLRVLDNSTASGSKVKWSRSLGVTPSDGVTVLAKMKCDSVSGDQTYLGNVYLDDGVKSVRFALTPTRIYSDTGQSYNLDGIQWHTYRFTMRNSQCKVYIDESATPVISATMTTATDGVGSRLLFGSGASAATQDVYFDYVRYTVDNDYIPGSGPSAGSLAIACDAEDGDDRCYISAGAVPLSYSATRNRVKFSLRDKNGNVGYSAAYDIKISSSVPPSPVTNFTAISGPGLVDLSWTNPNDPWFTATMIRYRTDAYPTGPTDGTLLCDKLAAPGSNDSYTHTGLEGGIYYYSAFARDQAPNYSVPALASATPGCMAVWLNENFDNRNPGPIGGQGAWTTVGSCGAQVICSGLPQSRTGCAILLDSVAACSPLANLVTFDARSAGFHYVTLDVSQDATGAAGQLIGYASFLASDSTEIAKLLIQKNRLLVEYGSGGSQAILTASAANQIWYRIKILFNVQSRTFDLWLDGTSKGTGYAWKGGGVNLAKIEVGSVRNINLNPQKIHIDNLTGETKPANSANLADDGAWTPSLSKLHFSFEPAQCAGEYQYSIGIVPNGTSIRGWTSCQQATDVVATGLSLADNQNCYVNVRVGTGLGTWGDAVSSNGIKVAPGVGIRQAKGLADGGTNDVKSIRGKVVTATFPGYFYVQEPGGYAGIKILSSATPQPGYDIDVCGVMCGAGAERYLDATGKPSFINTPSPGIPTSVSMSAASVGGTELNDYTPGVLGGLGPNNIGLLALVYGQVTQRQTSDPKYFYIDDGCGLKDGTFTCADENVGVRVIADPASYAEGSYVVVRGIVSCFDSGGPQPQILPVEIQILKQQ